MAARSRRSEGMPGMAAPVSRMVLAACVAAVLVYTAIAALHSPLLGSTFANHLKKETPGAAPLVVLHNAAQENGAMCLDGSPAAYYFSPGTGDGVHNWLIHFEGGGWCTSLDDCIQRAASPLGSSRWWPPMRPLTGHLSRNPAVNPDLHSWNAAYLPYCDGASFSGNVSKPQGAKGNQVFFRGAAVLDSILGDLLERGLGAAQRVVVTGCSAGGLAAILHCDAIAERVGGAAQVKCMPDAGFFLDIKDIWGRQEMQGKFREAVRMQNVLGGVNERCVKEQADGEEWKCFYAPYVAPFVRTPLFIVNPLFDTWQIAYLLLGEPTESGAKQWAGCQYSLAQCTPKQVEVLWGFANELSTTALKSLSGGKENGAFLFACFMHCPNLDNDNWWQALAIDGTSLREAAGDWILERGSDHFHVDKTTDYERGTNPSCRVTV